MGCRARFIFRLQSLWCIFKQGKCRHNCICYKCRTIIREEATVSEWPMDPAVDALRKGFVIYNVCMQKDGTVDKCEKYELSGYDLGGSVTIWRRSKAPACIDEDIEDVLTAKIWAK